jgi:glutamate racemase
MEKSGSIGVIDSGIGGFTVLKELQLQMPGENYIYFGDSLRMPYGERENNELIVLGNAIIHTLEAQGVKIIVLACNTLSSLITELTAGVPLFSVIEAGVKATIIQRQEGSVGLIATTATVKNRGYQKELLRWTDDVHYVAQGTQTLAKVINDNETDLEILKRNIVEAVEPILKTGRERQVEISELLLGCTHFPIVASTIHELYPRLKQINPARGLVKDIRRYLEENDLLRTDLQQSTTRIQTTGDYGVFQRMIAELSILCDQLDLVELAL